MKTKQEVLFEAMAESKHYNAADSIYTLTDAIIFKAMELYRQPIDSPSKWELIVKDEEFWNWVDLRYERFMKRWELSAQPEKGNWSTEELYDRFKRETAPLTESEKQQTD